MGSMTAAQAFASSQGEEFNKAYGQASLREMDLLTHGWTLPNDVMFMRCASCCRPIHLNTAKVHSFAGELDLVCAVCDNKSGTLTYWPDILWPPPENSGDSLRPVKVNTLPNPKTVANPPTTSAPKGGALITKKPAPPRKITLQDDVRETFGFVDCKKPSGHLDVIDLGHELKKPEWGGLILSSSRYKDAHAAAKADAAIFFDSGWKNKWAGTPGKPEREVRLYDLLQEGTNGLEWPDMVEVLPAEPPSVAKLSDGPVIYVPWQDMKAADLTIHGPYALAAADMIRNGKFVQVGCIGGHGRTGTFAAMVLTQLDENLTATMAINWLRMVYCSKAVEKWEQEDSVFHFNGEEAPPKPSKFRSTYTGNYSGGYYQQHWNGWD